MSIFSGYRDPVDARLDQIFAGVPANAGADVALGGTGVTFVTPRAQQALISRQQSLLPRFQLPRIAPIALPPNNAYSNEPAPLSATEIAQLDNRRIAADRLVQEAQAAQNYGRSELDTNYIQDAGRLRNAYEQQRLDLGSTLAGRGVAFSPGIAGRAARALRDSQAEAAANSRRTRDLGISQLAKTVSSAEQRRNDEIAAIERMRSALTGDMNRLLPGVNY